MSKLTKILLPVIVAGTVGFVIHEVGSLRGYKKGLKYAQTFYEKEAEKWKARYVTSEESHENYVDTLIIATEEHEKGLWNKLCDKMAENLLDGTMEKLKAEREKKVKRMIEEWKAKQGEQ